MRTRALSSNERDALSLGALVAPILGLTIAAQRSNGSLRRAGKHGLISGLVGAFGLGSLGLIASKESEQLEATAEGVAIGAIGLGALGSVLSLAWEGLRSK